MPCSLGGALKITDSGGNSILTQVCTAVVLLMCGITSAAAMLLMCGITMHSLCIQSKLPDSSL